MNCTNISFRSLYDGNITKGVEYTDNANLAVVISGILAEHKADDCFILFPFNCSFTYLLTTDYCIEYIISQIDYRMKDCISRCNLVQLNKMLADQNKILAASKGSKAIERNITLENTFIQHRINLLSNL